METSNFSSPNKSLPNNCVLRPARVSDIWSIRLLVFSAKLDPTQIRWQQFWVIECNNEITACGQLRNFDATQELGSLIVKTAWRGRGFATYLTQNLINFATRPLYLECLGQRLADFYSRFGFEVISFNDLPKSLKPKFRVSELGRKLLRVPVIFMRHSNPL
ncbi:MAG: GNAT family N-acetyltransferase [Scytonematopsis contorta HA4267-MV1]|jgi:amino-acid N-acetyltransferase|nr:GNAT family N-acetyltransferase [Scytonematopsis contorta HA4267-MV1]